MENTTTPDHVMDAAYEAATFTWHITIPGCRRDQAAIAAARIIADHHGDGVNAHRTVAYAIADQVRDEEHAADHALREMAQ